MPDEVRSYDSADELRDALVAAMRARSEEDLVSLCRSNGELIGASFDDWTTVPEEMRADREAVEVYVQAMGALAKYFADRGQPQFLQRLQGAGGDNPVDRWQQEMNAVDGLMSGGNFEAAAKQLAALEAEISKCSGSAVDEYLPVIVGRRGEALFRLGRNDEAFDTSKQALQLSLDAGDIAGAINYAGNLGVIRIEQGQRSQGLNWITAASNWLIQIGEDEQAASMRTQYDIKPLKGHLDVEIDI